MEFSPAESDEPQGLLACFPEPLGITGRDRAFSDDRAFTFDYGGGTALWRIFYDRALLDPLLRITFNSLAHHRQS